MENYKIDETKVLESRISADGQSIRRRRLAADGTRFTTYERVEKPELVVIKSQGGQEYFDRDKLRRAIIRSVGKFVPDMQVEEIINRVENNLLRNGNKIPSRKIGEEVLSALFDVVYKSVAISILLTIYLIFGSSFLLWVSDIFPMCLS